MHINQHESSPVVRDPAPLWGDYRLQVCYALIAAAAIRLVFSVGLVGGFPQDDFIYANLAKGIAAGDTGLAHYADLPDDYRADPSEWFALRVLFTYPVAFFFKVFGPGEWAGVAWPMVMSLVTIAAAAGVAREAFGREAAAPAAWLMAVAPVDVISSTRLLVDAPFAAWLTLGFYLGLRGAMAEREGRRGASACWLLAGLCFGAAYLNKVVACYVIAGLLGALALVVRRGARARAAWLLLSGPAAVVLAEGVVYGLTTGRFWLHHFIIDAAWRLKMDQEVLAHFSPFPWLSVASEGYFKFYAPILFFGGTIPPLDLPAGCSPLFWAAAAGAVVAWRTRAGAARSAAAAFVWVCLLLEFVPVNFRTTGAGVEVFMLPRQERFILLATPFAAALGAGALLAAARRLGHGAWLAVGLAALAAAGGPSLVGQYRVSRASLADIRHTAAVVAELEPPIFSDHWTLMQMEFFAPEGRLAGAMDLASFASMEEVPPGIVVLGGSRGIELDFAVVAGSLPGWARALTAGEAEPPPTWSLIAARAAEIGDHRPADLKIYLVGGAGARPAEGSARQPE